jgi:FkbM family methyltransferase
VRDPFRFIVLQLVTSRVAGHRLRGSGLTVYLRHGSRDVDVFKEVFVGGDAGGSYDPPRQLVGDLEAGSGPTVLDLGGNIGLFGLYVLGRWPGAAVRSFEPDPTNLPILERAIAANGLQARWTLTPVAVGNREGEMLFVSGLLAESRLAGLAETGLHEPGAASVQDGTKIPVRVVDLFAEDHAVDLIKIDIEGGEWSILTDPRLPELRARAVVIEWHADGCPEPDPRGAAIRLLRAAGYAGLQETEDYGHRGLLWAWRESPGELDSSG